MRFPGYKESSSVRKGRCGQDSFGSREALLSFKFGKGAGKEEWLSTGWVGGCCRHLGLKLPRGDEGQQQQHQNDF